MRLRNSHLPDLEALGSALELGSELFTAHICKAAKRAIAARKGRKVGPREYNTVRSTVLRSVHR